MARNRGEGTTGTERQRYTPTMEPISAEDIPALTRANSKAAAFVREFLDSGNEAVLVKDASKSFASSLKQAITKDPSLDARAFRRGDQIVLARGRAPEKVKADETDGEATEDTATA